MNKFAFNAALGAGLLAVAWVGAGMVGHSWLALLMTVFIAAVYGLGAWELRRFRWATATLAQALAAVQQPPQTLESWLDGLHPSLRSSVRLRVEGERVGLPGPALTPYLVGLLVMLGMLGTFLGMIVTFQGTVFALEGSTDLQSIRGALAAPIKGLGLSFGTSVAGVAASAMLGLMSAFSRRERLDAVRELDQRIATVLRPFALVHQRQEVFRALQQQSQSLPEVAAGLQALMAQIERRNDSLNGQLQQRQAQFHQEMGAAYTALAQQVGSALNDSLSSAARAAGDSLRPVVTAAMAGVAEESARLHERVQQHAQTQLGALSAEFGVMAQAATEAWTAAREQQAHANEHLLRQLDQRIGAWLAGFDERAGALLDSVRMSQNQAQAEQRSGEQQRLQAWSQALSDVSATLQGEWQRSGEQALLRQQAVFEALERSVGEISSRSVDKATDALDSAAQLLQRAEHGVEARLAAEADWTRQHGERMDQLAALWRQELAALRHEEAVRGQAAVDRLGELQAALASQLATLGAALEGPMTRLMQTAAEVPQAAAGVIAGLRQELSRLAERDNLALEERNRLLERMAVLLESVEQVTGGQRAAVDALLISATTTMERAVAGFQQTLESQAGSAADQAAQLGASAVELAALGSSFEQAVGLFSASNDKLIAGLQQVEDAVTRSIARSDEQLDYYVAQAREVIDLSISSQREIVDDLRRLRDRPPIEAGAVV